MNEIYGIAFTVLFNIGPLFQMVKIMSNGNSDSHSYGLWVCGLIGQICVLGYCYVHDVNGIFNYVNSVMGIVMSIVMLCLIYCYRDRG